MPISYVGGKTAGRTNANSAVAVDLTTGLTGGSGGAPLAGDLVVVTTSVGTQARQPALDVTTPTGYTALTVQRTTATTYDSNVCACYKVMGGTPDTEVTVPGSASNLDGLAYSIQVFRGVDITTPMDTMATYATGTGTNNLPNGAAITPVTAGAWINVVGGGASATGTTLYTAAALTNFLSENGADTNDGTVGAGYYTGWTSGAYDPAAWTGGSTDAANSWAAITMALRPAADYQDADLDGSGVTTTGMDGNATSQTECSSSGAASASLSAQSTAQTTLDVSASSASGLAAQWVLAASFTSTSAAGSSFVDESSYPEPLTFGEVLGAEILVYELAGDRSTGGFADTDMAGAGVGAVAFGAQALQTAVASSSATAAVTLTAQAVQVLEASMSSSASSQTSFDANASIQVTLASSASAASALIAGSTAGASLAASANAQMSVQANATATSVTAASASAAGSFAIGSVAQARATSAGAAVATLAANAIRTATATASGVATSSLQLSAYQQALWQAAGQDQSQVDAQALQVLSAALMAGGSTTQTLNTEAPKSTYFSIGASSAASLPTGAVKQADVNAIAASEFTATAAQLRQGDVTVATQADADFDAAMWMPGGFAPAFAAVMRPAESRSVMRPAEERAVMRPIDTRDVTHPIEPRAVTR